MADTTPNSENPSSEGQTPKPAPTPPSPDPVTPSNPWLFSASSGGVPGYFTPPTPQPKPAATTSVPSPSAPPVAAPSPTSSPIANPSANAAPKVAHPDVGDTSMAGVIDTIEAIVIALIVALTFRAFIVEAFVIPTGSMAPTLLGAHYQVICPKCGFEYDLETPLKEQAQIEGGKLRIPPIEFRELGPNRFVPVPHEDIPAICPNCRYPIAANELPQYLRTVPTLRSNGTANQAYVWANNGDRILVLKYLYSIMEPRHWDVIVFKEPQLAQDNYIKRLVALPGETVQIIAGDIYIQPAGDALPLHRVISRKPEELQQALWQVVYDNNYYATDEGKSPRYNLSEKDSEDNRGVKPLHYSGAWINPWEPAKGTETDWKKGPIMAYAGKGPGSLVFHPIPENLPPQHTLTFPPYGLNILGYNNDLYADEYVNGPSGEFAPRSVVGDLRLETTWTPTSDHPSIKLTLGRPNNCYRLTWDAATGLTLDRYSKEKSQFGPIMQNAYDDQNHTYKQEPAQPVIHQQPPALKAGQSYRLALNNVDHAVQFYIDGQKVLSFEEFWNATLARADSDKNSADWSNSENLPAVERQLQASRVNTKVQIDVDSAATLSHLRLLRDLYYTQTTTQWALVHGPGTATQDNSLTLGADEFFAIGDNSRRSNDGRLWSQVFPPLGDLALRPGVVPRRFLLGKAFFVYWPAGYTPVNPASDVPILRDLPLVPNFGKMRVIR